jgi:putative endopeptidase
MYPAPDAKDSTTNVLHLDAAELELPTRDYYLEPAFEAKLAAYRIHIAKMLALVGMPAAKTARAAADVIDIETAIAKLSKSRTERRDLVAAYSPIDAKELSALVKSVDWPAYWSALGVTPSEKIVLVEPAYFAQLDALRAQFTPAQWASYFTYHAVSWQSFSLGKATDDEDFELQKVLWGVTAEPERSKRCVDETVRALGELLGRQYVETYFPASSKQQATKLVAAIAAAVGNDIADVDWMSAATKTAAAAKLAGLVRMVGYPDRWRASDFLVRRDDFGGNELRASAFNYRRLLARTGEPVDRSEWSMNAFAVNAYYDSATNRTALPAGFLQPPYFAPQRSISVNFGGLGWYIGHELTHAFDDQGAKFDVSGNLDDWWQPADKVAFEAKAACVADQYSTFEVSPGQSVNGRLTLGEDIADLGGVKAAFRAYRTVRKDAKPTVADGFTEDQQFFVAVAQDQCTKERPETMQRSLATDTHAPPRFRVDGALRNLPAFGEAFHCARGAPMNPIARCQVW